MPRLRMQLGLCVVLSLFLPCLSNHLIQNFENLSSDKISYTYASRHSRRSTLYTGLEHDTLDDDLVIDIQLSGQKFKLILTKVIPPLAHYENFSVAGRTINADRFYDGFVSGHSGSSVSGYINHKGDFEGQIIMKNDTWIVESSDLVFTDAADRAKTPTIVFKESDLDPSNFDGMCGVGLAGHFTPEPKLQRKMRQSPKAAPTHNTCPLLVIVDHTFSAAYDNDFNAITHAITYFVKEGDQIFQSTVFGDAKGYMLSIARFEIFTEEDVNDDKYPWKGMASNIGSSQFLKQLASFSRPKSEWNEFCLIYAFTSRDFGSVLGEAYTGGQYGGVCKIWRQGIVTMKLQGDSRSKFQIGLTFAHEAGHSFSSGHDKTPECMPGGDKGNYLMHPMSQPGIYDNNFLFSPCSRNQIGAHLANKGNTQCFVEPQTAFCGNNVVEDDEKCDCGFGNETGQCYDKCCIPASSTSAENKCQLRPSAQCSPTAGECCNGDSCQFKSSDVPCGVADECAVPRKCDGISNDCPEKTNAPNGQLCASNTKSCKDGHCADSACVFLNLTSCSCPEDNIPDKDEVNCVVCCQPKGGAKCEPIHNLAPKKWSAIVYVGDGDICTNDDGYCDVFHRCRLFQEEGLLLKVVTRLFNSERWSKFASEYWWAIALIFVSVAVIIGVFVHFCAIYTPTHNPNVKTYKGPKYVLQKKYRNMKSKRQERSERQAAGLDQADGAVKPKRTWDERRKKTASKMTQKRRVVLRPPNMAVTPV